MERIMEKRNCFSPQKHKSRNALDQKILFWKWVELNIFSDLALIKHFKLKVGKLRRAGVCVK